MKVLIIYGKIRYEIMKFEEARQAYDLAFEYGQRCLGIQLKRINQSRVTEFTDKQDVNLQKTTELLIVLLINYTLLSESTLEVSKMQECLHLSEYLVEVFQRNVRQETFIKHLQILKHTCVAKNKEFIKGAVDIQKIYHLYRRVFEIKDSKEDLEE